MSLLNMSFNRTPVATFRIVVIFAALLSLPLAPVRGMTGSGPCSELQPAPMARGACCETMTCCVQTPEQPTPPAVPPARTHSGSDFPVALMAAKRPLLCLIPAGQHDFVSHASVPLGRSLIALAILCIRLI